MRARTLLVDNYDSYVDVLAHLIARVEGELPVILRQDAWTALSEGESVGAFARVVLGPGPGHPAMDDDLGVCASLVREDEAWDGRGRPILGVCLGHQALAARGGGTVARTPTGAAHGRVVGVRHDGCGVLFEGVPSGRVNGLVVTRYHSLAVTRTGGRFVARAWDEDDGTVMAIEHVELPRFGVQFHPESVCTAFGERMYANFLGACERAGYGARGPAVPRAVGPAATDADEGGVRLRFERARLGDRSSEDVFWSHFGGDEGEISSDCFWLDTADEAKGRFSFMGARGGAMWRRATFKLAPAPERGTDEKVVHSGSVSWRVGGATVSRRAPGTLTLEDVSGEAETMSLDGGFVSWLDDELRRRRIRSEDAASLPFEFQGGFVGYLGYEMRDECDSLPPTRDSPLPDAVMFLADRFVVIDHVAREAYVVGVYDENVDNGDAREDTLKWVSSTAHAIEGTKPLTRTSTRDRTAFAGASSKELLNETGFVWRRSRDDYIADIKASQEAIVNGDTYEVCLTNMLHRVRATGDTAALRELYSELRRSNAAPYASFLSIGGGEKPLTVLCCSPERFLRHSPDGSLEAKPIKGTTARIEPLGGEHDRAAALWLESNVKDRAENLMIVDLLRNDLARVSDVGTVEVPGLMLIESYATVHQLVSTVRARRRADVSQMNVLRSTYPGGSMTGAPKIRTMEIIDSLETGPRMVYSGSIGFFSFSNAFDLNIVIRTVVCRGRDQWIGAGGAITILSDPEEEWREIELKSSALLRAVARVETTS